MPYDPDKHHRRSVRLKDFDYSQPGAYYVTLCTIGRLCLFGEVVDGIMILNDMGRIVEDCWHELPAHYPHVALDAIVIMPNHVHAVIVLVERPDVGADFSSGSDHPRPYKRNIDLPERSALANTRDMSRHALPEIVRAFKASSTFRARRLYRQRDFQVWQRNYYERIVRSEDELNAIRAYIACNPGGWDEDDENPRFYP
jgi:putative transposase